MLSVETLKECGVNTEEGLGRCLNNEAFYLRLVGMALDDGGFEKLPAALAAGDLHAGFEAAHALKRVLGNLALTPIYTPVSELTELLRRETAGDYQAYLTEILAQRDKLKALSE